MKTPVLFLLVSLGSLHAETPVSFVRDVMPILNKAGCTQGTCHGAAKGKNGFKLSLRGYDPEFDYRMLIHDLSGRRFNRADPGRSLNVITRKVQVPANPSDARRFLSEVLIPLWRIMPTHALYERALDIQARYRYSFYDSLIIAAARRATRDSAGRRSSGVADHRRDCNLRRRIGQSSG